MERLQIQRNFDRLIQCAGVGSVGAVFFESREGEDDANAFAGWAFGISYTVDAHGECGGNAFGNGLHKRVGVDIANQANVEQCGDGRYRTADDVDIARHGDGGQPFARRALFGRLFGYGQPQQVEKGDVVWRRFFNLKFRSVDGQVLQRDKSMEEYRSWHGAWAAIPTPFHADFSLDLDALRRHVSFLCRHRIDGIVACGTTGEAATLTQEEKRAVIETVLDVVADRVPVIAGVGTNDTRTTIENAKMAQALGVAGLLVVTPYYNKPNQEGLYRHFAAVADAVSLPQIVYVVPGRTGCRCLAETVARVALHENIVGIKDATGDMLFATETHRLVSDEFLMFSGDDGTTMPFIALGGVGTISVVANIAPKLMRDIVEMTRQNRVAEARKIHETVYPLFKALFSDTSPIPLKAMLSRTGLGYGSQLRSPLFADEERRIDEFCAPYREWLEGIA